MTTNQKVAGSSPAERSTESPANRGVLQLSTGSIVINTAEGLEVAFSMPKLKGRDREAPPLYSFECLPLLPEEPAGHEATAHQESARAQREQRSSVATAGLRQLLLLLGLLRGLLFGLLLGFLRLGLPGRGWSRRRLGCRRRSGLRRGSRSRRGFRSRRRSRSSLGAAAADAAWLTSCTHSVDPLGLVVMVEPFSSNSNSSVSELASIKSVAPCALPLWAVPCIGAHWLALLPLPETSND